MSTFEEEKVRRLTVSLPDNTHQRLAYLAKHTNRSMTKFIIHMIDESYINLKKSKQPNK